MNKSIPVIVNKKEPEASAKKREMAKLTPAGLARRVKRHLQKTLRDYFAITQPGFEPFLEQEIRTLPDVVVTGKIPGGVSFKGMLPAVYHANLKLRTANRVLMRIDTFIARSLPELFQKAKRIHWELFTGFEKQIAFEASSSCSRLHHTDNIIESVLQGLQCRMGVLGVNVSHEKTAPIKIFIRFSHDKCTLSVDSSGELLHKRGYRQEIAHAPLRETVAAGLLMFARWERYPVIADPLCGSGTFLIEAALMARNRAPGDLGREFSCTRWPGFNPPVFERIKRDALGGVNAAITVRIVGSDISQAAVGAAQNNADRAGVASDIALATGDCLEFNKAGQFGSKGLIIANLPYGKRAYAKDESGAFCRKIGEHLKKKCAGWDYVFLIADRTLIPAFGLTVTRELRFENGGIPVTALFGTV